MSSKRNPPPAMAARRFPLAAGLLLGLGLGGFFDGIVLHQLLQWHHMASSWYPVVTLVDLRFNAFLDGLFHSVTYLFVLAGLFLLWRAIRQGRPVRSAKQMIGALLAGFGLFNVVEGTVSHLILGIHHVNETVSRGQWLVWDIGFVVLGVGLIVAGWLLLRAGAREAEAALPRD